MIQDNVIVGENITNGSAPLLVPAKTSIQGISETNLEKEALITPLPPELPSSSKRNKTIVILLVGLGIGGILAAVLGYRYWQYASSHETTDNATVAGSIHQVSSKIEGTVSNVLVSDNQVVAPGQLLVQLDRRDYENKVQKAQADYNRYETLYKQGAIARQQLDTAQAAYTVAEAQKQSALQGVQQAQAKLAQAQEGITSAQAKLAASRGGLQQATASGQQTVVNQSQYEAAQGAIAEAEVSLKAAQLQLSYINITAPSNGRIGKKNVEVGNRVQVGAPLMAIVDTNYWVIANFKETQLNSIKSGQPVEIKFDAFRGRVFSGHVDSISPASGSQFTLLPPDNATGNFTKIVQRIPVKISLDAESLKGYESQITPGLSAEVTVGIR